MIDQPTDHSNDTSNSRRAMLAGIGGLAAGAFLASTANAGPLTPPPGPISSTPGPEPRIAINAQNTPGNSTSLFRITQPGSYYLTGNITGESGKAGIDVISSGVSIDLMGYELRGVPGSLDGIRTASIFGLSNISIQNGSVRDWDSSGIELKIIGIVSGRIENVHARSNGNSGIAVGSGCTVTNSTATDNGGSGVFVGIGCTVSNCTAVSNGGNGISVGNGVSISHCTANANDAAGITLSSGCSVTACSVNNNDTSGITASTGCLITQCAVSSNSEHGILLASDCYARENACDGNGDTDDFSGISVTGSDSRIENSNCTDNRVGIQCTGSGNFFSGNTCSGNLILNWDIAANNACLVVNATLSPAVTGNFGGVSPGSTNPYANYTF